MTCVMSRKLTLYRHNVSFYDVACDARGGPGGAPPTLTPRRKTGTALKNVPRPYRALNPRGRGARGRIGFIFRVCRSLQKIKNLVLFLVILFGSGYSGFRDNLLFYPRPGLFLKRLSAKKFFKNFFDIWG